MLTSLGLTPAEQALYEHLVRRPPTRLAELTAGQGESVLPVVDRLVARGLLLRDAGPPERIVVLSPRAVLEPLYLAHASRLADTRRRKVEEATRTHYEIVRSAATPSVELLRGAETIVAAHDRLKDTAEEVMRFWDSPPYLHYRSNANSSDESLLSRGVTVRVLYDPQAVNISGRPAALIREAAPNVYGRVVELPLKLAIADRSAALVLQVVDDTTEALLIREPVLVDALIALFEAYWERAVPLGTYAATQLPADGTAARARLDLADREVLVLLAAGLTDREIAENLGRNERTVRDRIQRIKTQLGAQTRYQAGYVAARRGWISPLPQPAPDGDASAVG